LHSVRAGTALASVLFVFALVAPGPPPTSTPPPETAAHVERPRDPGPAEPTRDQRKRDQWLLSLEGVVHVPSDVGVQAGVEFPFRLRFFTGFGFMPVEWLNGFIAGATDDARARRVLELPDYTGTIWRLQAGYRPFKKLGLTIDAGYAHATIHGSLDLGGDVFSEQLGLEGSYRVRSALDIWLVEVGYQWQIAHRGVIALGLGVMSTFNADTTAAASENASDASEFTSGARRANDALESYGTVPTLTLRVGVDLL
jgi:hypothetical protein